MDITKLTAENIMLKEQVMFLEQDNQVLSSYLAHDLLAQQETDTVFIETIKEVKGIEKTIDYTNPVSISINIALITIILYFAVKNKTKKS
jgi:hypothetical protein